MDSQSRYAVRPPRADDASALGAVHSRVWQVTYAGLMDPNVLAGMTPEASTERWRRWLPAFAADGRRPDGGRVLVGALDDEPVGFVMVGPARDEDPPVDWQLYSLNVLPEHQGTGLAQLLVQEALGERAAYLWVARGNHRAIRFYERNGFALDGTEVLVEEDGVVELRMVRPAGEVRAG